MFDAAIYSEDSFITLLLLCRKTNCYGLSLMSMIFERKINKLLYSLKVGREAYDISYANKSFFAVANTKLILLVIDLGYSYGYGDGYDYSYGCALSGMLIRC